MPNPPRKPGRPRSSNPRRGRLMLNLTASELARIEAYRAALGSRKSLAVAAREALLQFLAERGY